MQDKKVQDALLVDVQDALTESSQAPSQTQLTQWANLAYSKVSQAPSEVTIRLVDVDEITQLNRDYRSKDKATNVLSFPFESDFDLPEELQGEDDDAFDLLGDVIICHQVILDEAKAQSKSVLDHYAHMVVHGILHLCGYDHQDDVEAEEMEALEVKILAATNIENPYN